MIHEWGNASEKTTVLPETAGPLCRIAVDCPRPRHAREAE